MLELYLLRHGIAAEREEYSEDALRPLTGEGKRKTKQVAQQLFDLGLRFDLILTSPLVRARQTADILKAIGLSSQLEESTYLTPEGNIYSWLSWLEEWQNKGGNNLALVGHEPNLGEWTEILVWGEAKGNLLVKKAGVIGVKIPETGSPVGRSLLFWLTPPKFLL
ncbi:phosphohistidine phosphatase SixA [Aerosakkonemataceae cyanobacterium BLCC-F154]|uniref:Phosphohistidine phosphatase SixA n=1 Tax=Floridaenema fluviatile BLCC-F154 TaxID=3153640 RepID=A0ABV4Y5T8_9CYAN